MLLALLVNKFWTSYRIDTLTGAMTAPGRLPSHGLGAEREQEQSLTACSRSSNVTSSVPLSFSGPAVRYNAEFTKRIPVTGLGGFSEPITSISDVLL